MKYRNINTGFVFESDTECKGEGWECLSPPPEVAPVQQPEKEDKPKPKRIKKHECNSK